MSDPPETLTVTGTRGLAHGGVRTALIRVLQCDRPLGGPELWDLSDIDELVLTRRSAKGSECEATDKPRRAEIHLADGHVSRPHARLGRKGRRLFVEDLGSKNGTRVNGDVTTCCDLEDGDLVEIGHTFFLYRESALLEAENEPEGQPGAPELPGLRSLSPEFDRALRTLAKLATSRIPIVLLGETGTGKEVVAQALHRASGRTGRFVAINCGAIPRELLEAELFGTRRGAYTGAVEPRLGLVRSADGGTLFLDEIAELPPEAQVALLRVLETQEVVPVGETRSQMVDFRVVAATNRDLASDVETGRFRSDLFARLAGLAVTVPPLRDRLEDLGILIPTLLSRHGAREDTRISVDAARALLGYRFPLNVRELEKALQTALALGSDTVELASLPGIPAATSDPETPDDDEKLRARVEALLHEHQGNISAVARAMGRDRVQVRRWIRRFELRATVPK